jgi:hypothetical protein
MRMRELKRKDLSVWPPLPDSSFGRAGTFSTFAEANQSILTGVRRTKNGLWLTMQFDGRDQSVLLIWDAPPSVEDIESMLSGQVGRSILAIGDLEVK